MLFTKKKKLQRDRDAGLVFRWRGGYRSNIGGSTIAFLLTSMLFAGAFLLLNIYLKSSAVPSKYRASMVQLGQVDSQLEWWMERNSPGLPMWESNGDEKSVTRVKILLENELNLSDDPIYKYEDVDLRQLQINEQRYYTVDAPSLPSLEGFQSGKIVEDIQPLDWQLTVTSTGELNDRLPAGLEYGGWIPESWRGLSVKFIIAVDAKGSVMTATPVEWETDDVVKNIENWIYTITFKPKARNADDITTGILDLRYFSVEAKSGKEVQP